MSGIDPAGDFGGLRIGGLQLALPMSALREVVPCGRLERLPARAEGLLGAIDLRGVLVPVLDLRPLIGLAADPLDWPCVVLVIHDGLILGLLYLGLFGLMLLKDEPGHMGQLLFVLHALSYPTLLALCFTPKLIRHWLPQAG